jgi:hypothetical protein
MSELRKPLGFGHYIRPAPVPVAIIPLTEADAALIDANPHDLRLWVARADRTYAIIKPHWSHERRVPVMIDWVQERADADGHVVFSEWRADRLGQLRDQR